MTPLASAGKRQGFRPLGPIVEASEFWHEKEEQEMATRQAGILRRIRDEAKEQLTRGWGDKFARQIFGTSSRGRRQR